MKVLMIVVAAILLIECAAAISYDAKPPTKKRPLTKKDEDANAPRQKVIVIDEDNIDLLLRRHRVIALGYFAESERQDALNPVLSGLYTAAQNLPQKAGVAAIVGKTSSAQLKRRFGIKKNTAILLISDEGDKVEDYPLDDLDADALVKYINAQDRYTLARVTDLTMGHLRYSKRDQIMIVYALLNKTQDKHDKMHDYYMRRFDALVDRRPVDKEVHYAVGDIRNAPEYVPKFGDPITNRVELPILAADYGGLTYKYEGELNLDAISQWIDDVKEGKVKRYARSAGLVTNVPGTLYTLTTDNYQAVTQEWSKDVVVIFYSPTCPFSKEFLEVEVPKLLPMVDHVSSLIIAKMNCIENECMPGIVSAYPTIVLYKGCKRNEKKAISPLNYFEIREADDLFRWLKRNSYYSIPKKSTIQPSGEKAADPIVAALEQVGGEADPALAAAQAAALVM